MQGDDESDDVTRRSLDVRTCQVRPYLTTSLLVTRCFSSLVHSLARPNNPHYNIVRKIQVKIHQ